jgi:hypothetical protein
VSFRESADFTNFLQTDSFSEVKQYLKNSALQQREVAFAQDESTAATAAMMNV